MGNVQCSLCAEQTVKNKFEFPHYTCKEPPIIFLDRITLPTVVSNDEEQQHLQNVVKQRKKLNSHPCFETVQDIKTDYREDMCMSDKILSLTYPYHKKQETLTYITRMRNLRDNFYPELIVCEIWFQLASVCQFLWQNKTCHGDIRSSNVFLQFQQQNPSSVKVKVLDSYFINAQKTNYQMFLEAPQHQYFLSVSQMQSLRKSELTYRIKQQDEIFSIGMTMLEVMSLQSSASCYMNKTCKLDYSKLDSRIGIIQKMYHPQLIDLLKLSLMLDEDAEYLTFQNVIQTLRRRLAKFHSGIAINSVYDQFKGGGYLHQQSNYGTTSFSKSSNLLHSPQNQKTLLPLNIYNSPNGRVYKVSEGDLASSYHNMHNYPVYGLPKKP